METLNLPLEFQTLLTNLITEGKCACHFLNPHKTRILMWKKVEHGQTTYYLRIGIQKFIAQEQTDRNGETYWRYWIWEEKPIPAQPKTNSPTPSELDSVTKFNQRQNQALNQHGSNPNPN